MADIILGARRPQRARKLARSLMIAAALLLALLLVAWFSFQRATTYPVPKGKGGDGPITAEGGRLRLGESSLERAGGVWVLRLEGSAYEMGVARGRLLAGEAAAAGAALETTLTGERPPSGWLSGPLHNGRLRWRLRLLADGLPPARREELAGLAAGMRRAGAARAPSYQRLVWRTAALDLGAGPGAELPMGGVASGLGFAVADDSDGRLLVGRAFSLPGAEPAGEPVLTVARPEGRIAWAGIAWASQIGVVTGVNAEGLVVALNPTVADDVRVTAPRPPLPLLARDVLEECATLEEALALLESRPPLGAGSLLIADGKSKKYVVVERTPERQVVRRPVAAGELRRPLTAGDFLEATELARDAENDRARRLLGRPAREARFERLAGRATPDPLAALAVLRDRNATAEQALPLGHPGAVLDIGAQHVALIDPVGMMLWVGEGHGAAGSLRAFDLRAELRGEPPRAMGPETARLAADATIEAGALQRATLARTTLREAGMLARTGRRRAAEEAVARAMALAPDWPGPYRLAARLARSAGDAERARELYREYLARSPAEAGGLDEAKGVVGGP